VPRKVPEAVGPLESRQLLSWSPVADTKQSPFSAIVNIDAYVTNLSTGKLEESFATGTLVDSWHVLTCAHSVEGPGFSKPTFLRVYPGRNSRFYRPFGEATVTATHINEAKYRNGAGAGGAWDIAILDLDRNIGSPQLANWVSFGWTSDQLITQIAASPLPLRSIGYPGEELGTAGADFMHQYDSYGSIQVNVGLTRELFWHSQADFPSVPGVSGSPIIDLDPAWKTPTIIGIQVGYDRVLNGTPMGRDVRITKAKWDWLVRAMGRSPDNVTVPAPGPVDRPDLMDADRWFGRRDSTFKASAQKPGANIEITSTVYNGGTARADSFVVSFYLSTDNQITKSDKLLGNVLVNSANAQTLQQVRFQGKLPTNLKKGTYFVGWIIDSTRRVRSYSWNLNVSPRDPNVTGYVSPTRLVIP
jgi:V8-like Glu-specific endopeptidase